MISRALKITIRSNKGYRNFVCAIDEQATV